MIRPDSQVVNPRIFNPDPNQIRDVRRINDGTVRPVSDNFQIVDHGKSNNSWASEADYQKSIGENFKYTDKNFKDGFNEAARTGKPVILLVGGKDVSHTQSLIEGPTKAARDGASEGGGDAVYIYADRQTMDKNSELGKYVSQNVNENLAYTGIFALTPDANGEPHLDKLVANTWGARGEISSVIKDQLQYAQRRMDQRKGQFKIPDSVDTPGENKPEVEEKKDKIEKTPKTPGEKALLEIDRQRREIFDAVVAARTGDLSTAGDRQESLRRMLNFDLEGGRGPSDTTYADRQKLFDRAIEEADKIKPEDIELARQEKQKHLELEKAKEGGGEAEVKNKLTEDQRWIDIMENMPGITRFEKGLSNLNNSQFADGIKNVQDAFSRTPDLATKSSYIDRLADTPYDIERLEKEFPGIDFKAARNRIDANKNKPVDNVGDIDPGQQPKPEGQPPKKEPEATPQVKPETRPETQPERQPEKTDEGNDQTARERLGKATGEIVVAIQAAKSGDYSAATAQFQKAISLADGLNTADIQAAMTSVQAEMALEQAKENPDGETLERGKTESINLQLLDKADALTRVDYGMYLMGNNNPATGKPDALKGLDQISEAAKRHPELFKRQELVQSVVERARAAGLDPETIKNRVGNADVSAYLDKPAVGEKPPESKPKHKPERTMFKEGELADAKEEAANSDSTLFLKFGGSWCPPCRTMDSTTLQDQSVKQSIAENGIFGKVAVESDPRHKDYDPANNQFADNQRISSYPTTVAYSVSRNADGTYNLTEKGRFVGIDAGGFKRFLKDNK